MRPRDRQPPTGGTMVEAALLMAVMLMVIIGIMELGRAWFDWNLVTHAVHQAARQAAVKPLLQFNDAAILQNLDATLQQGGLVAATRSVTFAPPLRPGNLVQVSAEVSFRPVVSLLFTQGAAAIPLRAAVVTRYELSNG